MNSGDTAWLIISSALVLLMTPGLAFFYGGLVRDTDVINTIKMSFISLAVIALEWAPTSLSVWRTPQPSWRWARTLWAVRSSSRVWNSGVPLRSEKRFL